MTLGLRYIAIASSALFLLVSGAMAGAQPNFERQMQPRISSYSLERGPQSQYRPEQYMQLAAVSISPSQAKSIALGHVPGSEFLDIKLVGGNTYIVRVIKAGRRIDVYVDASTGRVKN